MTQAATKQHRARPTGAQRQIDRRGFLEASVVAGIAASIGGGLTTVAFAASLTKEERDRMTPDQIIELMKDGNKRFRKDRKIGHDFLGQLRARASSQFPAAMVLGCVDSRIPVEIILDLGIGEAFIARVAGNVADEDVLGSMEFGCKITGAKVIVVLGHTDCGAVKGAIENVQLGNLTALLAKIRPAVASTKYAGERSAQNKGFVNAVARTNVYRTIEAIRTGSAVLATMEAAGALKIVGAMYDIETAAVDFFPGEAPAEAAGHP